MPEVLTESGARVRVVAGEAVGVTGPVSGIVSDPLYLDVAVDSGSSFTQPVREGHSVFVYVFEGEAELGFENGSPGEQVSAGHLAVLADGDEVRARTATTGGRTRFLLVAARPIGEPVARHGPFVMNTREEIHQAVRDFQEGRIG